MVLEHQGSVGNPSRWSSGLQEDSFRGGFLLAALEMYLKNDMKVRKETTKKKASASVGSCLERLTGFFR